MRRIHIVLLDDRSSRGYHLYPNTQQDDEFAEQYLTHRPSKTNNQQAKMDFSSEKLSGDDDPKFVDWRQSGIVTPVKDQVHIKSILPFM